MSMGTALLFLCWHSIDLPVGEFCLPEIELDIPRGNSTILGLFTYCDRLELPLQITDLISTLSNILYLLTEDLG